jgi:pyrroline-5-carboxylate reductase
MNRQMKIAFIGAGKMATALASGIINGGVCGAGDVIATDVLGNARDMFSAATGAGTTDDNATAIRGADVVVLAVKPQVAESVVAPLKGAFSGKLLISIAAGLSLSKLCYWSDSDRVVRVMPNTPTMVGKGASAYATAAAVDDADRRTVDQILGAGGICYEVSEAHLDAVTGVSGSGPAYVFEFIQAMVDGAVDVGLDAGLAEALVVQTVAGAAEMVQQKKGTPDELRVAVTSPGGTTAAGLKVLEDADFRQLMADVIRRATERSVELGG